MDVKAQIYTAKVMHKRLFPKINAFTYGVYYLAFPLPHKNIKGMFTRFDPHDIGFRDGRDPFDFARSIITNYGLANSVKDIMLITMPKILGYVFNPVSFYFCLDQDKNIKAVICEVHNTFKEQHIYLCAHEDHQTIKQNDWLEAEKIFHVSPFLERNGKYRFRFSVHENKLNIFINYVDQDGQIQLITSMVGSLVPLTAKSLRSAFFKHPFVTLKTILLIHFQAFKLMGKKIKYKNKPQQNQMRISASSKFTKK